MRKINGGLFICLGAVKRRAAILYLEGVENEEFYHRYKGKYDIEIKTINRHIRNLEPVLKEGKFSLRKKCRNRSTYSWRNGF
jgi:hypothetical protein